MSSTEIGKLRTRVDTGTQLFTCIWSYEKLKTLSHSPTPLTIPLHTLQISYKEKHLATVEL